MSLQHAVSEWCGKMIQLPPRDGAIKWFKIDQLRNGFIIAFDSCAVFGSVIDAEAISYDGENYWQHRLTHKDNKKIRYEWMIWEMARVMLERGERLSEEDSQRLALAVRRLEIWL